MNKLNKLNNIQLTVLILVVLGLIISGPFLTIWALNTLFLTLAIPYDFVSWLAIVILYLTIHQPK